MADACNWPSPGRGTGGAGNAASTLDALRHALADAFHEPDADRFVLTHGATDALHLAIHGVIAASEQARPRVLASNFEHNAVSRPLAWLACHGQIELVQVETMGDPAKDRVAWAEAARGGVLLAAVTCASNVVGTIFPVREIAGAIRSEAPDAIVLADACQTAGTTDLRFSGDNALGADLAAFGAHKGHRGPPGIGALWVGPGVFDPPGCGTKVRRIEPVRIGGTAGLGKGDSPPEMLPWRFECGTPNSPAAAGWLAALRAHDLEAHHQAHILARELNEGLRGINGVTVHTPLCDEIGCTGVVAFEVEGISPGEAEVVLDSSFGIACRTGIQCSPWAHQALGTRDRGGTIRLSTGATTTRADIDAAIAAVRELAGGVS